MSRSTSGPVAKLRLDGRFDAHRVPDVRERIEASPDAEGLELELSEVEFVDSTALALLVETMKRRRKAGGQLVLRCPSDPVRVILELTALDSAFTVDNTPGVAE